MTRTDKAVTSYAHAADSSVSLLQRAFQLASSGEFTNVTYIAKRLSAEGYLGVSGHLSGRSLRKQLNDLCRKSVAAPTDGNQRGS